MSDATSTCSASMNGDKTVPMTKSGATESEVNLVDLNDDGAFALMIARLQSEIVLIETAGVYAVLAQPTLNGVQMLDTIKKRLPHKWYTSCLGDVSSFLHSIPHDALPDELRADNGRLLENAFTGNHVRVRFTGADVNTPAICNGQHQTYICQGKFREFFTECERAFRSDQSQTLFAGASFSSCIASSANISGEPSITERQHAIDFARARGIHFLITDRNTPAAPPERRGSISIFGISRQEIVLLRKGTSSDGVAAKLPAHLHPKPLQVKQ